jgi:hypothetical protein
MPGAGRPETGLEARVLAADGGYEIQANEIIMASESA